jgi:dTDP-glucose 4,6-dehydratase
MNLMITGGAGFIGSRFAEMLLTKEIPNQYSSITVVDNLTYSGNLSNLDAVISLPQFYFHKADICNKTEIESIIEQRSIDVIANFAAESHVDRSIESAFEFLNTNVMGTQNLLDLAKKHGITRYLQVSTDEVYGSISTGSWEEDEPLKPNSPYSASKAGADLLVLAYGKTYGMNVGITASALSNPPDIKNRIQFKCPYKFAFDMEASTINETLGFDAYVRRQEGTEINYDMVENELQIFYSHAFAFNRDAS